MTPGGAHPPEAASYAVLKARLAAEFPEDRVAYTDAKVPFFWATIQRADEWAQQIGWEPDRATHDGDAGGEPREPPNQVLSLSTRSPRFAEFP